MRLLHRQALFPITIALLTAAIVLASMLLDGHGHRILLVPGILAAGLSLLSAAALRRAPCDESDGIDWRELASLLAIAPLVLVFGVVAGSALYLAGYAFLHGRHPAAALAAGAAWGAALHAVFEWFLQANLFSGLLFGS